MKTLRWALLGGLGLVVLAVARARRARRRRMLAAPSTRLGRSIRVDADPYDVYAAWRRLEELSEILAPLCAVERLDAVRSCWTALTPDGELVQWEAEIVDDVPGELIAWITTGGPVEAIAVVHFSPDPEGQGTRVEVEMEYRLPEPSAYAGAPDVVLERGLRRLEQLFDRGYLPPAYARPSL